MIEFREFCAFIEGRNYKDKMERQIQGYDSSLLILVMLVLNPFFKNVMYNSDIVNDYSSFFRFNDNSHGTTQQRTLLRNMLLEEFISNRPDLIALANLITNLTEQPVKNVASLTRLTEQGGVVGFYSSLITAHCYMSGTGVARSLEEALALITKAVTIAEKDPNIVLDLSLPLNLLRTSFHLSDYDVSQLYCRIFQMQALNLKGPFSDIGKVHGFFKSKLQEVSNAINALSSKIPSFEEKRAKLSGYHSEIREQYLKHKLDIYLDRLKNQANTYDLSVVQSIYNELYDDTDLKDSRTNLGEFFDTLLNFCKRIDPLSEKPGTG